VEASRDNAERLSLVLPGRLDPLAPTNWSFGQLAALIGAPGGYLPQLPAALAGSNLQYGLTSHRAELVKSLETDTGRARTVRTYLDRVTKAHILAALREGASEEAARGMVDMKQAMAEAAEQLLARTGWLPERLGTRDPETVGQVRASAIGRTALARGRCISPMLRRPTQRSAALS
jgi:hypothetical protein